MNFSKADNFQSPECFNTLSTIKSYWTAVAPCNVESSNGIILVDLFHDNINYTMRSLLISKYLQIVTGRSLIGLLGTPGVVARSCGSSHLDLNRIIATSFGIETIWEVGAPDETDQHEAMLFWDKIECDNAGIDSDKALRRTLLASQLADGFPIGRFIYDTSVRAELCGTVRPTDSRLLAWTGDTIHLERWFRSKIASGDQVAPIFVTGHIDYNPWGLISEHVRRAGGDIFWFTNETSFSVYRISGPICTDRMLAGEIGLIERHWFDRDIWPLRDQFAPAASHFQRLKGLRYFYQSWTSRLRKDLKKEVSVAAALSWKAAMEWKVGVPVVIVFGPALADQPLSSRSIYEDRFSWLKSIVAFAAAHPERNWIVKIHPADLNYDTSGTTEYLRARYSHLRHISFILGEMPMNFLVELGDVATTVNGTPGLQFAAAGKPTICTGDGRYTDCGFVHQPQNEDAYHRLLLSPPGELSLSEEQASRARLFEYASTALYTHYSPILHNEMLLPHDEVCWMALGRRFRNHVISHDHLFQSLNRMIKGDERRFSVKDTGCLPYIAYGEDIDYNPAPVLRLNMNFDFCYGGTGKDCLVFGFHGCEEWGVWTNGELAILAFGLDLPKDQSTALIELMCGTWAARRARILYEGLTLWQGLVGGQILLKVPLPSPSEEGIRFVALAIICENPGCPAEPGISEDSRTLGVPIIRISVPAYSASESPSAEVVSLHPSEDLAALQVDHIQALMIRDKSV